MLPFLHSEFVPKTKKVHASIDDRNFEKEREREVNSHLPCFSPNEERIANESLLIIRSKHEMSNLWRITFPYNEFHSGKGGDRGIRLWKIYSLSNIWSFDSMFNLEIGTDDIILTGEEAKH